MISNQYYENKLRLIDVRTLCDYIEKLNWVEYTGNVREGVIVYQKVKEDKLFQINLPLNKEFTDYIYVLQKSITILSYTQNKSVDLIFEELLNPKEVFDLDYSAVNWAGEKFISESLKKKIP